MQTIFTLLKLCNLELPARVSDIKTQTEIKSNLSESGRVRLANEASEALVSHFASRLVWSSLTSSALKESV